MLNINKQEIIIRFAVFKIRRILNFVDMTGGNG